MWLLYARFGHALTGFFLVNPESDERAAVDAVAVIYVVAQVMPE